MFLLLLRFFLLINCADPKLFVKHIKTGYFLKISHQVISKQTKRSEPLYHLYLFSFFFLLKNFEKPPDKIDI